MNIKDLEKAINEKAVGLTKDYKSSIKWDLCNYINEVLKENGYDKAHATYDYSDKSNLVKIKMLNQEAYWPLYLTYKTTRVTKRVRYYNESTFTVKSVTIENIKYETFEDWMKAENDFVQKRQEQKNSEIQQLKDFISKNPEFTKMVGIYEKYKYQLN